MSPTEPILYITDAPSPYDTSSATWASQVCQNQQFLRNENPVWEWTPVLTPTNESSQLGDSVGISGWAINPHHAGPELIFTHPFGSDWEFFVAPDQQYVNLLAPNNLLTGVSNSDTQEYREAMTIANDPSGLNIRVPGVLGVEIDGAFVPEDYQAQQGDRVAVFGRWIVDCGHTDFHTEIHPPLLLAVARPMGTGTSVKVISRPFLVSQEFGDGALRQHFDKEITKLETLRSLQIEVHPQFISPPFSGIHSLRFFVRPSASRQTPYDILLLSYHLTVRSGIAIEVTRSTIPDEIQVLITMNAANYQPSLPPKSHTVSKQIADLGADALGAGIGIGILTAILNPALNPIVDIGLARGILVDLYDAPQPQSRHDSETGVTNQPVWQIKDAISYVFVDDDQPFPIYGWLTLEWEPGVVDLQVHIDRIQDHVPGSHEQVALVSAYPRIKMGDDTYLDAVDDGNTFRKGFLASTGPVPIRIEIWRSTTFKTIKGHVENIDGEWYAVFGNEKDPLPENWDLIPDSMKASFLLRVIRPKVSPGYVRSLNLVYDTRTQLISGDVTGSAGNQIHVPPDPSNQYMPEIWFTISQPAPPPS